MPQGPRKITAIANRFRTLSLYRTVRVLGYFGAGITVLIACLQYFDAKQDTRVRATLTLFEKYNADPFIRYRERVLTTVNSRKAEAIEVLNARDPQKWNDYILNAVKNDRIETDLFLLLDFYDGIDACTRRTICDADTVGALFQPRAAELFHLFYPYIKDLRDHGGEGTFASGLQRIANMPSPAL